MKNTKYKNIKIYINLIFIKIFLFLILNYIIFYLYIFIIFFLFFLMLDNLEFYEIKIYNIQ